MILEDMMYKKHLLEFFKHKLTSKGYTFRTLSYINGQIELLGEEFAKMRPEERVAYLKKSYKLGVKEGFITSKIAKETTDKFDEDFANHKDLPRLAFNRVSEFFYNGVAKSLQSGQNIMPVFVRAERPFDYENDNNIEKIKPFIESKDADDLLKRVAIGSWQAIESIMVQDAIKKAGYDGFYVKEDGRKNLAVYEHNQIKSAIGNTGAFSPESNDIRYSLKPLTKLTPEEALMSTLAPLTSCFGIKMSSKNIPSLLNSPINQERIGN
jgi:hypothetical protein